MIVSKWIPQYGELTIVQHGDRYTYVGVDLPLKKQVEALLRPKKKKQTEEQIAKLHGKVFDMLKLKSVNYLRPDYVGECEVPHCKREITTTGMLKGDITPMCDACKKQLIIKEGE